MRSEKKAWEKGKLDSAQHNASTLLSNVKGWLSWGNSGPPTKLFHEGEIVTKPARLAGAMNSFFINKVKLLRERISTTEDDPMLKLREMMQNRKCSFSLRPVSPEEVLKIISNLKNSKSTGTDFIDTWTVKLIATDILPAVTHIINLSISQCTFPSPWKTAKVVPLLKKGDPLTPKNYRPVALLPIFSKILEKVVF